MNWTLVSIGEKGMQIAEAVLFASMAGQMPVGHLRIVCASTRKSEKLEKLTDAYRQVFSHFTQLNRSWFTSEIDLVFWNLPTTAGSIAEQVADEDDRFLCQAFFSQAQTEANLSEDLGSSGPTAALEWHAISSLTTDQEITSLVGQAEQVIICGSLCDSVCAAGVRPLTERIAQLYPDTKISLSLLGPVRSSDRAGVAMQALKIMPDQSSLTSFAYVSMPEDCLDSRENCAHFSSWALVEMISEILRGAVGNLAYRVKAEALTWDDFGRQSVQIRSSWNSFLKTVWLFEAVYYDSILKNLNNPNWLRDRLTGWYNACFSSTKAMTQGEREQLISDFEKLHFVTLKVAQWLEEIENGLPAVMQWSQELQEAKTVSSEHYANLLDSAAQLALLRHEAEKSGMADERFIHRHSMEETEAETLIRQISELEEHVSTLEKEQNDLDISIGGRLKRNMLNEFVRLSREEAEQIRIQADEAHRVIDRAAELAKPEEMPKVDAARSRLERMERHLAVLTGRYERAQSDAQKAEAPDVRLLSPAIVGQQGGHLFPVEALHLLASGSTAKDQRRLLEQVWPWKEVSVRQLTDKISSAKNDTASSSPLSKFFDLLIKSCSETEGIA